MTAPAKPSLFAVLLAGGSGTRLWPLSTQRQPKQFLAWGDMPSLLRQTAERLQGLISFQNQWVVCGEVHALPVAAALPELPASQILAEPVAKNTLAAIALAAIQLRARDPEAVMAVLPADHFIPRQDWPKLHDNLALACLAAGRDRALVTLGIPPSGPVTGFGYMEQGERFATEDGEYFSVRAFHEKPDAATAQAYLRRGGYLWNSGIFVWKVRVFLEELQRAAPETARSFEALASHLSDANYPNRVREVFEKLQNISVDYGLMEKARKVRLVPAGFAWDDVGSLDSFEKILPGDAAGNHTQGQVITLDAKNNLLISQSRALAVLGMEGVMIVETPEAVLVLPKNRAQDVKKIVEHLKEIGKKDIL